METATLLLIIAAVFIALLIAGFQYLYKNKEKSQLKYWLSFFRFLSIFLILLLLINPSINKNTVEIIKPKLLVAIDNSTSIKYNSQGKTVKAIVELLKNDAELNSKFLINYYGFGNNLYVLDSLNFNENQTNLSFPFQEFSKLYSTAIAPVILISDGNQTIGNNVEFINYKSPVFPFIVGDTAFFEDIYIKQLNVNRFTNINNKFPVELFINYSGNNPISKYLKIYHKGKMVYSKELNFSNVETVKVESFFLTAAAKGTQYYTATIEELKKEKNTVNNTKNFSINVIEERSKILILASIVHPDLGMLKKSIESNDQHSVTILNTKDFKDELSDYQLIILNQPSAEFKKVFNEIHEKKINHFIVTGLSTDWDFLNKTQHNFSKNVSSESENYNPVFNPDYASFLSDDIGFSDFSPLEDNFGDVTFSIPYNTLLFQQIGTIKTEKPLLVTFENNNQRGAVLLGENSWRWRMSSFSSNNTFEFFDAFISNLIQYLVSTKKSRRLIVSAEPIYYANETIQISASYLDKNFNFDSRAKLWFTISNKETKFLKKIPFAALQSKFTVELSNIPTGEYMYTVSVENNDKNNVPGSLKILPFDIEQQFTNANDEELKKVATKTNGETFYASQEPELIRNLIADTRFKSVQKTNTTKTPLIDWKWILGLIILSLSIEWFTRKYFGKI